MTFVYTGDQYTESIFAALTNIFCLEKYLDQLFLCTNVMLSSFLLYCRQATSYANEYMLVEGGSQEIASILSDFYSPSFKTTFQSWLETVPDYPKPFEFQMGTITDLLNINFLNMLKKEANAAEGCLNNKTKYVYRLKYVYTYNMFM